jgi:hypothetical protein
MTTVEVDRVKELEQEVKNLSRLVREMAAREKLLTLRLQHLSKDHVTTMNKVKELDLTAKKMDGRITQVQARK